MEIRTIKINIGSAEIACKWFSCGKTAPLLIDIHGGGFCNGDESSDDGLNKDVCKIIGINILSIGYRIAPQNKYPAAIDDCIGVTKYVLENKELLYDRHNVFITGHSAGGNLAAGVCLALGGKNTFKGLILNYPWLNLSMKQRKRKSVLYSIPVSVLNGFLKKYIPNKEERKQVKATPFYATEDLLRGLPDTLFVTAERDNLKYDSLEYQTLLQKAGVHTELHEMKGAVHGFTEMAPSGGIDACWWLSKKIRKRQYECYREWLEITAQFIKEHMGK